jgi:hypothetical protein
MYLPYLPHPTAGARSHNIIPIDSLTPHTAVYLLIYQVLKIIPLALKSREQSIPIGLFPNQSSLSNTSS